VSTVDVKSRLIAAAFELFGESGFEQCTVDHIVARAGVGRTTFFRYFRTKEDVVFPDHESLLAEVADFLADDTSAVPLSSVCAAARRVLRYYIAEDDRARARFVLSSSVTSLRDREIAVAHQYQRVFRTYLGAQAAPELFSQLVAEVQASTVVSANNHIIRRWLRGDTDKPLDEFDEAARRLTGMDWATLGNDASSETAPSSSLIVIETRQSLDALLPRLREVLPG